MLDVGANIGVHTVAFADIVGSAGEVHAFEPQRLLFQTLCANIALNSITNVSCHHAAVSDRCGSCRVPTINPYVAQNFAGISLLTELSEGEEVTCVTIDSLELSSCDLIKIDAEGMQLSVIRGGFQTIRPLSPILYVENDRPLQSPALIRYLAALRYDLYWHFPPLYNPDNYFANPENAFGDTVSLNMVCLPEGCSWDAQSLSPVEIPKRKQISI